MSENIKKNTELLPCPFCGGEAVIHHEVLEHYNSSLNLSKGFDVRIEWGVGCSNEDCPLNGRLCIKRCSYWITAEGTLKPIDGREDGRKSAIEKWNTRVK